MQHKLFALLAAVFLLLAPAGSARAQGTEPAIADPDQPMPGLGQAQTWLNEAKLYETACRDIADAGPSLRVRAGSVLSRFSDDEPVLKAIGIYCALGNFELNYMTGNKCVKRKKLEDKHLQLIRHLALLRSEAARLIWIQCVEIDSELRFLNVEATSIGLSWSHLERLVIVNSKITSNIVIDDSVIRDQIRLLSLSDAGAFMLARSKVENKSKMQNSITVTQSEFAAFSINDSQVTGGVQLVTTSIKQDFSIINRTRIDGRIFARGTKVGGVAGIENATVEANILFDHLSADRVRILNANINGGFWLNHANVAKDVRIEQSRFKSGSNLHHMNINGDVVIRTSTFAERLFLNNSNIRTRLSITDTFMAKAMNAFGMRTESLYMSGNEIGTASCLVCPLDKDECSRCKMNFFNAEITHFELRDSDLPGEFSVGNARFRTLILSGKDMVMRRMNCGDCLIEQFVLLAARVIEQIQMTGAEIKGTLVFSENLSHARWASTAVLDLSEFRADAISANAWDLMTETQVELLRDALRISREKGLPPPRLGDGDLSFVPTKLTGARYRTIVPGRQLSYDFAPASAPAVPVRALSGGGAAAAKSAYSPYRARTASLEATLPSPSLLELDSSQLIRLLQSADPTVYDPQPYEELAGALTRIGESDKASDVRIEKINQRVEKNSPQCFQPVWDRIRNWQKSEREWGCLEPLWWSVYYHVSRYGYENWRAVISFLFFIALGTVIRMYGFDQSTGKRDPLLESAGGVGFLFYSLWFSLDRAIPPLNLDPKMQGDARLTRLAQHYFYAHRVIGTFLISIFAAGYAGLGQ